MTRKQSREAAFKIIYSFGFDAENKDGLFDDLEVTGPELEYIKNLVNKTSENLGSIDDLIRGNSKGFSFGRLFLVDLALLRLGVAEILHIEETPAPVVIDAVVTLAKRYSTEKSVGFINGILATIAGK